MKQSKFQKIKEYGPLIISIILFIATMISLPTRVEQLESKTRTLEIQTAQSGATLEAVASDVRDIKNMLMRQK